MLGTSTVKGRGTMYAYIIDHYDRDGFTHQTASKKQFFHMSEAAANLVGTGYKLMRSSESMTRFKLKRGGNISAITIVNLCDPVAAKRYEIIRKNMAHMDPCI